jgi:hypothetical protein
MDNEMPQGYKIREAFGTNPVSTKRDYQALLTERDDFIVPCGNDIKTVTFVE